MHDIILFGAGAALQGRLELCRAIGGIHVVEIWDYHPQMDSFPFKGESIPVCFPHPLKEKLPVYIIPCPRRGL